MGNMNNYKTTEITAHISDVVYTIEQMRVAGKSEEDIKNFLAEVNDFEGRYLRKAKNPYHPNFPETLEYIDSYYDKVSGTCGVAFKDTSTGEVVIGYAGTNWEADQFNDIRTDLEIAGGGGMKLAAGYQKVVGFYDEIAQTHSNITLTGHSLGANFVMIVALLRNVRLSVTYNGSPLYGVPYLIKDFTDDSYPKFTGRIIRFVSENDWLNHLSNTGNATFIGETYVIYNDKNHAIGEFLGGMSGKYIDDVLTMERKLLVQNDTVAIDIDGDGVLDIVRTKESLQVKNLFQHPMSEQQGSGERVKIDADALYNLSIHLASFVAQEFGAIKSVIGASQTKNEAIRGQINYREAELCANISMALEDAQLHHLLGAINDSFGILEQNKAALTSLSELNPHDIMRYFDSGGESGKKSWWIADDTIRSLGIDDMLKKIQCGAKALLKQLQEITVFESEYPYSMTPTIKILTYDTISTVSEAFVVLTNNMEQDILEVFKGEGLREGTDDAIATALDEVMVVEAQQVNELEIALFHVGEMAQAICANFNQMDEWLGQAIATGERIGDSSAIQMPESYQAYLEQTGVFDDKNVIQARDAQIEQQAQRVSEVMSQKYEIICHKVRYVATSVLDELVNFRESINKLYHNFGYSVTSKEVPVDPSKVDMSLFPGSSMDDALEPIIETHGTLETYFSSYTFDALDKVKREVVPTLEVFDYVVNMSSTFVTRIYDMRNTLKHLTEQAIYTTVDLDEIGYSHQLVGQIVERMESELKLVEGQVADEHQGFAMTNFRIHVGKVRGLLGYYKQLLNDCFGVQLADETAPRVPKTYGFQ